MVNSNALFKQFICGTSTGFCLTMFPPTFFAEIHFDADSFIDASVGMLPNFVLLAVSLTAVTALVTFIKGYWEILNNINSGFPGMIIPIGVSLGGVAIALVSEPLIPEQLRLILGVLIGCNCGILILSFLYYFITLLKSY